MKTTDRIFLLFAWLALSADLSQMAFLSSLYLILYDQGVFER